MGVQGQSKVVEVLKGSMSMRPPFPFGVTTTSPVPPGFVELFGPLGLPQ